ncbi:hypothetical protein [Pseudoalteromonas obscura]|uniref:Uncharacterized protein n=1 Tax=Pseudoalteromonas obscura TaxID=3048491 RepID=A0ABT7EE94_9GAMM|nr:hypothetical protein [Pseudoalteromonas sp. P94(2023)]MDK2593592.1 hypothetical protein [Pseudoalteromonas sp. P94(2023)]
MTSAERIGIPIVLLSGLWGVFEVILKAFELLNKSRDLFLKITPETQATFGKLTPKLIFWNDWLPLWVATVAFLGLFALVMIKIPNFVSPDTPIIQKNVKSICYTASTLPAFGCLGFFIGGISDIVALYS